MSPLYIPRLEVGDTEMKVEVAPVFTEFIVSDLSHRKILAQHMRTKGHWKTSMAVGPALFIMFPKLECTLSFVRAAWVLECRGSVEDTQN